MNGRRDNEGGDAMRVGKVVVRFTWEAFVVVLAQGAATEWIGRRVLGIVTGDPVV